jgi:hypothetical protein
MSELHTILQLRLSVAFLGERSQHHWWDTSFLNQLGFRYLELVFPKTSTLSALTAASEAACHVHDERIGRGRVAHLFRLPADVELRVRCRSESLEMNEFQSLCSKDAAMHLLDSLAGNAPFSPAAGPVRNGTINDLASPTFLAGLAATYASGFRTGTPVFPYFA